MQKQNTKTAESIDNPSEKIHFEDMYLKVGHKMHLTLAAYTKNSGESNNSYTASMIGYVPDSTLIMTMPSSSQLIGEPFVEGDQIHVRLVTGQNAYKFSAYLDRIIKVPFKYLHLSFPKSIQGQNIRKSQRIKCNYQATIAEKSIPANIVNLSICGAGIHSTLPLGILNSVITLSFTILIYDREIPVFIKAVIRSAKHDDNNDKKSILSGVEFTEMKPDQVFTLRHLVYQEIVEHPENVI